MTRRQQIARISTRLGMWAGVLPLVIGIAWAGIALTTQPHATPHPDDLPTWTPVGGSWNLTIQFLSGGSRQGQTERSVMTFLPDGRLTATFPDSPLLPAKDGRWFFTSPHAFHYSFEDQQPQEGIYVLTQIDAYLISQTAYEAGGVGVVYSLATHQPVGYNVTHTSAVLSGKTP